MVKDGEVRLQELSCSDMDMRSTELLVVVRTGDRTLIGRLFSLTPRSFTGPVFYRSDRGAHRWRNRKQVTARSRNVRFAICLEFSQDGMLIKSTMKL